MTRQALQGRLARRLLSAAPPAARPQAATPGARLPCAEETVYVVLELPETEPLPPPGARLRLEVRTVCAGGG